VSEEGLQSLRELTALTCLQLMGKNPEAPQTSDPQRQSESSEPAHAEHVITDAGLEPISHLTALTDLIISSQPITDEGLRNFIPLKNLTSLFVSSSSITDAGLVHLQGLTKLRFLDLPSANIEGQGLRRLPVSLERLDLAETCVNDEGVAIIVEQLPSLISLNLAGTRVTDAGIRHLARLTALHSLNLYDTAITADGAAALGQTLPGCQIDHPFFARRSQASGESTNEPPSSDADAVQNGAPASAGTDMD